MATVIKFPCPTPRVRKLRQCAEWTEEEFAELLDVDVETLCQWEEGDARIPDHAKAWMANTFGVSMRHLLGTD